MHLVQSPCTCRAGEVAALCGVVLVLDAIEVAQLGDGVTCPECVAHTPATHGVDSGSLPIDVASSAIASAAIGSAAIELAAYNLWGWPVTRRGDLIQLVMDGAGSAIAIPIPLCVEVTQILIARHCAPAVLAHPYASEHHMVLTGERFGALLPWPPDVYQVTCSLMLPPTKTICGPITWVQPPSKDSLRLSREIDVFGAVRTALDD